MSSLLKKRSASFKMSDQSVKRLRSDPYQPQESQLDQLNQISMRKSEAIHQLNTLNKL